jgi:RNA polymerase sigma-70 factor (ECF subfamily)
MEHIQHIHSQFGEHLKNFIRTKVKNEDDVSDIYQNVILKIITRIDTLKKTASLKSWIFTIANNQIIDYHRKRKPDTDLDKLDYSSLQSTVQEDASAYHLMEDCIHSLIAQLPDEYKMVVEQSEIKGISQKNLAESLGMNYVTLRSKVQRGRERLKKMLNDSCLIEQAALGTVTDCKPKTASECCGSANTPC